MGKGGGNDGSSLQNQRKLFIKTKSETEQKLDTTVHDAIVAARMSTCAYSGEPLQEPIVCDEYGTLYNKESVLTLILQNKLHTTEASSSSSGTTINAKFSHLRSLKKDIINVHPTLLKNNTSVNTKSHGTINTNPTLFICPLTHLEANGKQPFIVLRKCGCLISERAYKAICKPTSTSSSITIATSTIETTATSPTALSSPITAPPKTTVPTDIPSAAISSVCPVCSTVLASEDEGGTYIKLCPTPEELSIVKTRLHERSLHQVVTKPNNKKGSTAIVTNPLSSGADIHSVETKDPSVSSTSVTVGQKRPRSPDVTNTTTNTTTTTSSSTIHSSIPPSKKEPHLSLTEQQQLLSSLTSHSLPSKHEKFMNSSLTTSITEIVNQRIQEQSTKSSVYSALFHQPSKNQVTITSSTNTGTLHTNTSYGKPGIK